MLHAELPWFEEWYIKNLELSLMSMYMQATKWANELEARDQKKTRKKRV